MQKRTARPLLVANQTSAYHKGGMIAFGPDGYLHVALGDGAHDRFLAQDPASPLGAILRIDVDRHPIPPPGNLTGAHPNVLHKGLRNPWRFSFDRVTGDLYVGDVSEPAWDEINIAPRGN